MSMLTPIKVIGAKARRDGAFIPAPFRVALNHKPTLFAKLAMERWVALGRSVDDRLKTLAELRTSATIGCMW